MILSELSGVCWRLASERPGPFYLLDFVGIAAAVQRFQVAWEEVFPKVELAYSFKTNGLRSVTRLMRSLGLGAEVVSGPELTWAVEDGFPPERIYFDGPLKTREEIRQAVSLDVRIQVDSLAEMREAVKQGKLQGKEPVLSARLSTRYRGADFSRFGFTAEEYAEAQRVLGAEGGRFRGLHLHVGSNVNDPEVYVAALREYLPVLRELLPTLEWLDLGGGYPAKSLRAEGDITSPAAFAEAVSAVFRENGIDPSDLKIVLEPGRCLVEDFGYLLSQVHGKKVRPGRTILITDGGLHLVRSLSGWYHPVSFLRKAPLGAPTAVYEVFGSNCFESDQYTKALEGPADIGQGDWVVVGSAGGYDLPSANVWTRPSPAVYAWFGGDDLRLIRRAQRPEEMRERQGR